MSDKKNFRLDVIYEPEGRAREYNHLGLNIYDGCTHSCKYPCYVPSMLHKKPEDFHKEVTPRKDIMKRAFRDIDKLAEMPEWKDKEIMMCFTCDPYPKIEQKYHFTRTLMQYMRRRGLRFTVLTKSGMDAVQDFPLMIGYDKFRYGVTLSHAHQGIADHWEPGAASVFERMETLRIAKLMGIRTWVSMEPVLVPTSALTLIDLIHPWVDEFKVGKLNHNAEASKEVDWHRFGWEVSRKLQGLKKDYVIKDDLLKEMGM